MPYRTASPACKTGLKNMQGDSGGEEGVRFRDGGQGGENAMITTSFSPRMDRSLNRRQGETGNSYFARFFLSRQNETGGKAKKKRPVQSKVLRCLVLAAHAITRQRGQCKARNDLSLIPHG
jgi:hypothetical protein